MAFLDNSGDIILDAVLTDLGRKRMANGTFRIAKFALGDEEINYALFDSSDARGSAFYDLEILQSPILEALTADQSMMKSKLITLPLDNILYMPVFKINDTYDACRPHSTFGGFIVTADNRTYNMDGRAAGLNVNPTPGVIWGTRGNSSTVTNHICIDQGINTDQAGSVAEPMPISLLETTYIIRLDTRFLVLDAHVQSRPQADGNNLGPGPVPVAEQFIDDDAIATYYLSNADGLQSAVTDGNFDPRSRQDLLDNGPGMDQEELDDLTVHEVFSGPLGSVLRIVPRASVDVRQGDNLFTEFGSSGTNFDFRGARMNQYKFIDTIINITGATTGFSLDIPIRIIKGTDFGAIPA